MKNFSSEVVHHSISPAEKKLTTLSLVYPRFIHSELMTHRDFSRNAMSSRAVPVQKMIDQVRNNPAMPIHWGSNKPGMQAGEELSDFDIIAARRYWTEDANRAADTAEKMMKIGLHKQVANRVLEPFQWMHTIVTSTEWDNFFNLRLSPMAQPEFRHLAELMKKSMDESTPVKRERHIPFVSEAELSEIGDARIACFVSAARCARVSYLNHDGTIPNIEKDVQLSDVLFTSGHASPFEHIAFSDANPSAHSRNFQGWTQFRAIIGL